MVLSMDDITVLWLWMFTILLSVAVIVPTLVLAVIALTALVALVLLELLVLSVTCPYRRLDNKCCNSALQLTPLSPPVLLLPALILVVLVVLVVRDRSIAAQIRLRSSILAIGLLVPVTVVVV